jgi:hypothetical protein
MNIRRNAPWQLAILIDFAKSLPEAIKWCKKGRWPRQTSGQTAPPARHQTDDSSDQD